jgi:hypothetical protein
VHVAQIGGFAHFQCLFTTSIIPASNHSHVLLTVPAAKALTMRLHNHLRLDSIQKSHTGGIVGMAAGTEFSSEIASQVPSLFWLCFRKSKKEIIIRSSRANRSFHLDVSRFSAFQVKPVCQCKAFAMPRLLAYCLP